MTDIEITIVKANFFQAAELTNVLGVIDLWDFDASSYRGDGKDLYICRKGYHGLNIHGRLYQMLIIPHQTVPHGKNDPAVLISLLFDRVDDHANFL